MFKYFLYVSLFVFNLFACRALQSDSTPAAAQKRRQFLERWEKISRAQRQTLQPGCESRVFRSEIEGSVRGTVLLLHGFSACPQQFLELGPQLAAAGFDVLIPTILGHGMPLIDGREQVDYLPVDMQNYLDFVRNLNWEMQDATGIKMVGGLSLGGSLATQAVKMAPDLYERALIMTPLYEIGPLSFRTLVRGAGSVPLLNQKIVDWGPACSGLERQGGRAGICEFRIQQIKAAEMVGRSVLEDFPASSSTRIQFVGVEQDTAISNSRMHKVYAHLQRRAPTAACLLKLGANHSLLSRFDSPDENKFWLVGLLAALREYFATGAFIAENSLELREEFPLCAIAYDDI